MVATRWDISILDGTERNDRPRRAHRFHVGDKHYVVCGCGSHPVPPEYSFVVMGALYVCKPEALMDYEDDDPDRLVREIFGYVHPMLPAAVDAYQWREFEHRVHEWVCEHRAAAAMRAHRG